MRPDTCPNCGADIPRNAKACPECGSDEKTGWAEDASAGSLGVQDEEFNYDEFVKTEFGGQKPQVKPRGVNWVWWLVAIALLVAFVVTWVL